MASRNTALNYTPNYCPLSVDFGYQHGTNPTICSIVMPGRYPVPTGYPFWIQLSNALWAGYTVSWTHDVDRDQTTIESVDWRDHLHDTLIFAQFNMEEPDGRFFHILPNDWLSQKKTYVSRELDQNDFKAFQLIPPDGVLQNTVASQTLYSCATLLNWIGQTYGIFFWADDFLSKLLESTYPPNLDWNGGVKIIDAIQQLCDKCNAQFCVVGINTIEITLRGFTDNPFLQAFINGMATTCQLGVDRASLGEQLHDRGRRVLIQGERDRYEMTFVCQPNWNPAWTWDFVYSGASLMALFQKTGLTTQSKIKQMPAAYHDHETWTADPDLAGKGARTLKRTRMEMTIKQYLDEIIFRAYVVNFSCRVVEFDSELDASAPGSFQRIDPEDFSVVSDLFPLNIFPTTFGLDSDGINSVWPIARNLVSETNVQSVVWATSRALDQGVEHPFYHQQSFIAHKGVNLDIEEVINPGTGRTEYRCRIFFSEPQAFMLPGCRDAYDPNFYLPDIPIIQLALEKDIFQYAQGPQGLRTREQRVNINNLGRGFTWNSFTAQLEEASILTRNFVKNMEDGGAKPAFTPVRADDVAKSIATQMLFRNAVQRSGHFQFFERAGLLPDGLIDSVAISWGNNGLQEQVNFGTPLDNTRDILPPQMARLSFRFLDETELNRRRLEWSYKQTMAELREKAAKAKPDPGDAVFKGGVQHPGMELTTIGRHGLSQMKIDKDNFTNNTVDTIEPGEVIFG